MTTYSTSLKLALIGDGQEVGTWGQTTNTNLGSLLEQAIAGAASINMADANVTLTSLNGTIDQARNQVLVMTGANNAVRDVIPPVVKKTYIVVNNTTGGYAIRVIGASGTGVLVPNGTTSIIYCNGTSFFEAINSNTITGNSTISGNLAVGGTTTLTGALTGNTAAFSGVVTAPTAANGTNTTQVATTAFVNSAVTSATGSLGTMSTQNANAVAITGGNVTVSSAVSNTFNSTGTTILASSAPAIRGINFGVNEIAWAQSPSTGAILNLCDAAGNNGNNYSLLIRGLANGGATGPDLAGVTIAAGVTRATQALQAYNGFSVPISPENSDGWLAVNFTGPAGGGNDVFVPGSSGTYAWWFSNRGGGYIGIGAAGSYITTVSANNFFGFAWKIRP